MKNNSKNFENTNTSNTSSINANISNTKPSLKTAICDTLGVYGKCFIAGLSVVGAVMAIQDAVKANNDMRRKYNV